MCVSREKKRLSYVEKTRILRVSCEEPAGISRALYFAVSVSNRLPAIDLQ